MPTASDGGARMGERKPGQFPLSTRLAIILVLITIVYVIVFLVA